MTTFVLGYLLFGALVNLGCQRHYEQCEVKGFTAVIVYALICLTGPIYFVTGIVHLIRKGRKKNG